MTQEQKDLLLKDLCARLPYGVKILHEGWNHEWDQELSTLEKVTGIDERFIYTKVINDNGEEYTSSRHTISLLNNKPYLFPLSSMTEEQREEFVKFADYEPRLEDCGRHQELYYYDLVGHENNLYPNSDAIDWLNKNHFDYRGLIEKSLALDATNLNIY